jgi:DNA-binding XRE family transcriptional regulator
MGYAERVGWETQRGYVVLTSHAATTSSGRWFRRRNTTRAVNSRSSLALVRRRVDLSQAALAEEAGISENLVGQIERGLVSRSFNTLRL